MEEAVDGVERWIQSLTRTDCAATHTGSIALSYLLRGTSRSSSRVTATQTLPADAVLASPPALPPSLAPLQPRPKGLLGPVPAALA